MVSRQTIQISKGIAILAVIFLHSLSTFLSSDVYYASLTGIFYITLNQAFRFSVPLFLALSGFGLAQKYQNISPSLPKHLVQRLKKILPSYLFWSAIFIFVVNFSSVWQKSVGDILYIFLTGRADYHLYFVPLLFQFYVLFPFFLKPASRSYYLLLLLVTILVQIVFFGLIRLSAFGIVNHKLFSPDDQLQYRLVINWIFYFNLGIFISRFQTFFSRHQKLFKPAVLAIILIGFVWQIIDSHNLLLNTKNVLYATSFIRIPVLVYSTGVILAVLLFGTSLTRYIKLYVPVLTRLGQYSYPIYLSHTLFLKLLKTFI